MTIREGLLAARCSPCSAKATGQPLADYKAALKDPTALGLPASAKGNVEGYLFPATYEFATEPTPTEQLRKMVDARPGVLTSLGSPPDDAQRVLTIASIARGRGAAPRTTRARSARVIVNRLAKSCMKLQLDSTVSYAVQQADA